MRRTRTTTVLGSTAAAALLALTAACGPSGSGGDAGGSGGNDSGSGGSGGSGSSDAQGASLTKSNFYSTIAAAQKKAGSYTFDLTLDSGGQKVTGEGEADTSTTPAAAHVVIGSGTQKIETITSGGLVYLKGGMFGSDKWIKIDPKSKQGLGSVLGSAGSSGDPASQLAALKDVSTLKKVGSQKVDGTDTTEYDVTVSGAAIAKATSMDSQKAQVLPKTITYKLFVDKDSLVRQLTNTLKVQGQSITTEIQFDDYGKDVTVKAPPASQVTDKAPGLGGSLGG